jgi:RNase P/RNase MRP subunit p30
MTINLIDGIAIEKENPSSVRELVKKLRTHFE